MSNEAVIYKLEQLPENLKNEAIDFIDFLLSKQNNTIESSSPMPRYGSGKGMFIIHDDFDDPLEDFKDYM